MKITFNLKLHNLKIYSMNSRNKLKILSKLKMLIKIMTIIVKMKNMKMKFHKFCR